MAGNRFSFVTYSDDNNGCVVKSDDQKNKKADGSGVVDGKLIFTCPVEFRKEVTGITATPKLVFGAEKTMEWSKCSSGGWQGVKLSGNNVVTGVHVSATSGTADVWQMVLKFSTKV